MIYLISETPGAHGVFDTPTRTERMVYVGVRSVTSADFWRAYDNGVTLAYVFVLADQAEYAGERLLRYGDRFFKIVRTYDNGTGFELACEEASAYDGDPGASTE